MKIPREKTGAVASCRRHRALFAVAVLLVLLGGLAPAAAQDVRLFQIEHLGGTAEAGFLTDLEERSRSNSSSSNFDRVELSEALHLHTSGYVYHPRFLTFGTGIKVGGIQGLAGEGGNRFHWGGDFRFNILEMHRNSLSIYGSRLETESARAFAETYQITHETYGATLFQKWGWIPFELSYRHGRRRGGSGNQLDDSSDKVAFDGRYRLGERSDGRLQYEIAFEEIQGNDLRRQHLNASNVTYLGDEGGKKWTTNLRAFEERDGQMRRNVNGSTNFEWLHSNDFRTHYAFNSRWSDSGSQTATTLNANFHLAHQLYQSLKTDFEIYGDYEDASFRNRQEIGGKIAESYLKRLGDWGRLNVSVAPHASLVSNRLNEKTAQIFDESHVLNGIDWVQLLQQDIIITSIVVTSTNCPLACTEGPAGDYEVEQTGDGLVTRIRRSFGTTVIGDGDPVFVNYQYELAGDNDTLSTGVAVFTGLTFLDHWNVFGRFETLDFYVLSGDEDDLRFNSYDRYSAGVAFSSRWFGARANYEKNDATITPFWMYSGSASLFTYGLESWSGRLTADYSHMNQGNSDLTVDRYSVSGVAGKRFFKRGLLEAEGGWLSDRWSGQSAATNDIDALHVNLKYSWWYGRVEFKAETGYAQYLRQTEDRKVFRFQLGVRRVF